jgi:hypothetical protein
MQTLAAIAGELDRLDTEEAIGSFGQMHIPTVAIVVVEAETEASDQFVAVWNKAESSSTGDDVFLTVLGDRRELLVTQGARSICRNSTLNVRFAIRPARTVALSLGIHDARSIRLAVRKQPIEQAMEAEVARVRQYLAIGLVRSPRLAVSGFVRRADGVLSG